MGHFAPAAVPVVVTSILFTSIAFMVVSLRLFTRCVMIKNPGIDDWFMLAAMFASIGFLVTIFQQVKYGLGTRFETIPKENLSAFYQSVWITIPMYNLALTLVKISIVFQYIRIFPAKKIVRFCRFLLVFLCLYGSWTFFGSIFMCVPAAALWDETVKGKCMSRLGFWFSNAGVNIPLDILIFAIPLPLLKELQLPRKQKIGLMFVFCAGAFVCVTSIIRLKSIYEISESTDTSLDGVNAAIWSGIEMNIGIICASIPSLKPLMSKILPRLLSNLTSRVDNSVDEISYKISVLRKKPDSKVDKIKVEQSVYQQSDIVHSREGSETILVDWKTDCYSDKRETKTAELPIQGAGTAA